MRKDFLLRQKEWELDQARSAPEAPQVLDDDEREAVSAMDGKSAEHVCVYFPLRFCLAEVEMVDRILSQENQEFEALVSSMQDNSDQEYHQQTTASDYGSDEEEYDQLLMEVISRQGSAEPSTSTLRDHAPEQDQEMDISVG